jgi:hypothetical protein
VGSSGVDLRRAGLGRAADRSGGCGGKSAGQLAGFQKIC